MNLKVRPNVLGYRRDSYLGKKHNINTDLPVIDCALGFSQWGISPRAQEAHQLFNPDRVAAYPEMFYGQLLKPAILDRFADARIPPEQLFFGHGSFNLAERLIHKLIMPTAMLGIGPQFNEIPSEFIAAGGVYTTVPLSPPDYAFPIEALAFELATGNYSVLYIDNPNNPTGALFHLADILALAQIAEEHGTIVIIDEAYADFVPDAASAAILVNELSNIAVIRSFSKGLGLAAERVGYLFMSAPLADEYAKLDVPFEPTLYAATLAHATTLDADFRAQLRNNVAKEKALVTAALRESGYAVLPTHEAVSILTAHRPDHDIVADMFAISVLVEPGSEFSRTNANWDDSYCRIRMPKLGLEDELCKRLRAIRPKEGTC